MSTTFTLSDTAVTHIQKMLEKFAGIAFRITIKKTGCSGYTYHPEIVKTISDADISFVSHDITICLDKKWLHLLQTLHVDFVANKMGLKQQRLIFINPKESSKCGCGESFHIEDQI